MIRNETVWITRVQTPASQDKILPPIGEYHSLALSHLHIINTYNEHLYGFPVGNLVFGGWESVSVDRVLATAEHSKPSKPTGTWCP